jgi:type II secretion system protein C
MEALFKKYFWIVKTLGIAASTGLAASAITTQIGSRALFEPDEVAAEEGDTDGEDSEDDLEEDGKPPKGLKFGANPFNTASTSKIGAEKQKTGDKIQTRNIFCPTCVPVEPVSPDGPVAASGAPVGGSILPGEVRSTLPLQVMATMESTDPDLSFATIYDSENGVAGLYGRGDAIRPSVTVTGVDQGIVHLRNSSQLEYLQMGEAAPPPTKQVTPEDDKDKDKDKDDKPKDDRVIEGAEESINCSSEDACTVDRAFVESLMANPAQLAKQARIVPSQKDGETQGYKLYGIRRGTIPKLLGFKNGDMLKAVNGEDLTSVDKAMGLYTKLRRASNLSVTIERKGKAITKEITIQ